MLELESPLVGVDCQIVGSCTSKAVQDDFVRPESLEIPATLARGIFIVLLAEVLVEIGSCAPSKVMGKGGNIFDADESVDIYNRMAKMETTSHRNRS
jgi:hypothetical protein